MILYSVVTICRNEKDNITRTIESVLNQTFTDYQYIIIDGLSTDGTLEIIESYREKFLEKHVELIVISEKDSGIYDAMNKGALLSDGEFVNMLNAGDCFADNNVLANMSQRIDQKADVIYGNANAISIRSKGKMRIYPLEPQNLNTITRTMPFIHQTVFVKTKLLKENLFDEKYKIAADYKFCLTMYLNERKFQYVDIYIVDYYLDGVSSQNIIKTEKEFAAIREEAGLINSKSFSMKIYFFRIRMMSIIRKITPRWFRAIFGGGKI